MMEPEEQTGEWDEDTVEATTYTALDGAVRDLDPPEREALVALLHRHADGLLERLEAEWVMKVIARTDIEPHRRVFAMRRPTLATLAAYEPVFLGVPLAHLSRKGARLTLEGGRLIAPFATRRTVTLNEKGTQLFLYGRHLFAGSLVEMTGKPAAGDEVLVLDAAHGDYLGLGIAERALKTVVHQAGRATRSGARAPSREVVVKNRLDLGLYLRAQQEVPE